MCADDVANVLHQSRDLGVRQLPRVGHEEQLDEDLPAFRRPCRRDDVGEVQLVFGLEMRRLERDQLAVEREGSGEPRKAPRLGSMHKGEAGQRTYQSYKPTTRPSCTSS